jgi:hypothetical protein
LNDERYEQYISEHKVVRKTLQTLTKGKTGIQSNLDPIWAAIFELISLEKDGLVKITPDPDIIF